MKKFLLPLTLLLALGAGCTFNATTGNGGQTNNDNGGDDTAICQNTCGNGICEEIVCQGSGCPCAETVDSCPQDCSAADSGDDAVGDLIHVTAPADDGHVSSPVAVTGEARGTWYFEATFPVRVYDSHGNLLGSGVAQAQGDWMTEDFVPFVASIPLTTSPTTATGTIVLQKDNPSGLPENEKSLTVPVTF